MKKYLTLVIGLDGSPSASFWRETVLSINSLAVMETSADGFWQQARLDIEIMATSLVVYPLGLPPPIGLAQSYRFLPRAEYAPLVIVPPALDPRNWPDELGGAERAPKGVDDLRRQSQEYPVTLYMWRSVFVEVLRVVVSELQQPYIRVGFHCKTIGYIRSDVQKVIRAFLTAYQEFVEQLNEAGIFVTPARPDDIL
jgi:hypothetical protein